MSMTHSDGVALGAALRDAGIDLATRRREWMVRRGELALLDALLVSPDGTATTDDATSDIGATYEDGGHWRGSVPRRLAADRIIEDAGAVRSCRPARHRGYVTRWRLRDRTAAESRRAEVRTWLAAHPVAMTQQGSHTITTHDGTRQMTLPGVE